MEGEGVLAEELNGIPTKPTSRSILFFTVIAAGGGGETGEGILFALFILGF